MEKNLYREKNLKKLSSPEELQDYIRVVNPNVWILFIALLCIIAAFGIWAMFGKLETNVEVSGTVKGGEMHVVERSAKLEEVENGMEVKLDGKTVGKVTQIENVLDGQTSVTIETGSLADGKYDVYITIESMEPMDFIFQ